MIDFRVEFTSLCRVSIDPNGQVWLNRLADVKDGQYVIPEYYENMGRVFENRDRIFRKDGPSYEGAIGVWSWSAIPNQNNPETDYVQSSFRSDLNPIRVFEIFDVASDEKLVEKLVSGITGKAYYDCDTLFVYSQKPGLYRGVLCKKNEFSSINGTIALCDNVYALPLFDIPARDVFSVKWYQQFLNSFSLGKSNDFITIGDASEIIKNLILERLTWPLYKECISGTKKEWRHCKTMLEHICGESLYEAVALKLKCSEGQAKLSVKEFTERAGSLIDAGDIDSDVLAELTMHHDGLRAQCEAIVEQKWKAAHKAEMDAAEAEVEAARKRVEVECSAAKKKLQELEQQVQNAEQNKSSVLLEVSVAQKKLDGLLSEIEQYEALGQDALQAVRTKIAEAQKDMAGFIADLSVVMPQPKAVTVEQPKADWRFVHSSTEKYALMEPEVCDSWRDEYDLLHDNLDSLFAVNSELLDLFAAYLYAAKEAKMPLLVVGPYGTEVSHALSMTMYAREAGYLELGRTWDGSVDETIKEADDPVISIANLFAGGWADALPQKFAAINKQIICTHAYHEDLLLEPKGMYNYVLPVFAECFIEGPPVGNLLIGKRSKKYKGFEALDKHTLRLAAWNRLKLSKLMRNQIERVLTYTKCIINRETSNKDIEALFGVLPLAVLTGKTEILKDLLEVEKSLSRAVKAEIERYIEEE